PGRDRRLAVLLLLVLVLVLLVVLFPARLARRRLGELARHLAEGDLDLEDRVVARLVESRSPRRRADEHPREQEGERRVLMEVADQAAQQIRAPQERRVERGSSAEDHVVPT